MMSSVAAAVPEHIARWYQGLSPENISEAIPDPALGVVFSEDMVVGFTKKGNLASQRIDSLCQPIAVLFEKAYELGMVNFVLLQDAHHPDSPEFDSWAPHCIQGTEEAETIPELKSLRFSRLFIAIEKNSLNPFINSTLEHWMSQHPGLRHAIVVGNCTDLCVYQMAMHLRLRANANNDPEFRVTVPAQLVDTFDLAEDRARSIGALPHPGDFFHQVFLYHMAMNGIRVVKDFDYNETP